MASTVKLSSSLTSISLASPTEKNSLQNPFWYSLDGDDSFVATVAACAGPAAGELRAEKRGAYYALGTIQILRKQTKWMDGWVA